MGTDLEIIALGEIGLSGTAKLIERYNNQLEKRFRKDLIELAYKKGNNLKSCSEEDLKLAQEYVIVEKGGVFAALWDIGEKLNCGLSINLKDIPVYQETIEICNYLDINPYELESKGMYLLAADNGYALCETFREKGYRAVVIGHTTNTNDRIIKNGELVRYIEKNRGKEELER